MHDRLERYRIEHAADTRSREERRQHMRDLRASGHLHPWQSEPLQACLKRRLEAGRDVRVSGALAERDVSERVGGLRG